MLTALAALIGGVLWLALAGSPGNAATGRGRAAERAVQAQARLLFVQATYGPVEALIRDNRATEALLKLEELAGRYPGDAHGLLLKGMVLAVSGAEGPAAAAYAAAVRQNGEYVDRTGPVSRRGEIERFVTAGLARLKAGGSGSPAQSQVRRDLYYLKSRLAGGCE